MVLPYFRKDYLLAVQDGLNRLNEKSKLKNKKKFYELPIVEQNFLLKELQKEQDYDKWWFGFVITITIEALLCDPVYGGNKQELGWKWLNYIPWYPRPKVAYDNGAIL